MTFSPRSLALPLLAAVAAAGCGEPAAVAPRATTAPVVLISIDTLRADHLPSYGYDRVDTPAIDRLAADGVLFENASAQVPLTLPSHASLFTGLLPTATGVRSNVGFRLDGAAHPTLAERLRRRGYATGAAVSAQVLRGETGIAAGFESYDDRIQVFDATTLGALQRPGAETVAAAAAWLGALTPEKPFFLFVHFFEPHSPYEPPEPYRSRFASPYDGEIAAADAQVGRLLDLLRERRLYDGSLIVLLADHGEGLGDHGEAEHGVLLYREALHVPLIVKLPSQRRAGERVAAAVGLVDVVPTVLAELGVESTRELAGQALLSGPDPAPDRHIYSETLYPRIHLGWSELRSLTGARFHYVDGPDPELFDLTVDRGERRNLRDAERPVFHAWRDELRAIPLALEAATAPTSEEMARLAALGYLAASAPQGGAERLDPKQHVAVLARIQQVLQLHARGDAPRTIALCREILRQYPDLVDLYGYLASNLRRRGRLEEALSTYKEAVRRSPSLLATMAVDMAKLELDLGRGEAAAALAAEAMRWDPLEARLVLAGVAAAKGDYATAEHEAQQAVGDPAAPRLPALALLARVRIQRSDFDGAWQAVSLAQERVEAGVPAVPTLDATRGDLLARRGENAAAEAAFRREISRYPHTLDAYTRLAALLASEGRTSEVVPTLSAMVEQVPAPRAFDLAARTLEALGNPTAAEEFRRRGRRAVAAS